MNTDHTWSRAVLPYLPTVTLLPIAGSFDGTALPSAGFLSGRQRMFVGTTPGSSISGSPG